MWTTGLLPLDDTIAAIASGGQPGWRGIVRVSGAGTRQCLSACFRPPSGAELPAGGRARVLRGWLAVASPLRAISADVAWWPTERSFTRQPLAEIHLPGALPLVEAALSSVLAHGARAAQPGEFVLRAFLAGRIDLTQVEGMLGLYQAENAADLRLALGQLAGGLRVPLDAARERLLELLAHLEAGLDFAEEDIAFISRGELAGALDEIRSELDHLSAQLERRHAHADAPRVLLCGRPNVGKSSLFNALAGDQRAMVSPRPGTTRDYVEARLQWGDQSILLLDTAGAEEMLAENPLPPRAASRDSDDAEQAISAKAQQLSYRLSERADVRLLCLDATRDPDAWEAAQRTDPDRRQLVVWTKIDVRPAPAARGECMVSSIRGDGLAELRSRLLALLAAIPPRLPTTADTAARTAESIGQTCASLQRAEHLVRQGAGEEIIADELRQAVEFLARLTGAVYTDDLLDRIFSRFCIGK